MPSRRSGVNDLSAGPHVERNRATNGEVVATVKDAPTRENAESRNGIGRPDPRFENLLLA